MIFLGAGALAAQTSVDLPEMVIYSPRVANQSPAASFAAPVSALRYEPRVDVQARNLAEGQADVTIRGGTFENTGFRIGAVTVLDPQTGHYLAEIPVPPAMLGAPRVLTGADNALASTNVNVGSVAYAWRPVRTGGQLEAGFGDYALNRQEIYQGAASALGGGRTLGADVEWAHSASNGSVPYGDHRFQRVGGRVQLRSGGAQTDLYAGYQAKFFGWPDLYTPFGVNESENLQTVLFAVNHRVERTDGGWLELGAYHRRNKDDYEYNRLIPGLYNPYQHTTWLDGAALDGREVLGSAAVRYRAEVAADDLRSTALTAGRYHTRTLYKLSLAGEREWAAAAGGSWHGLAGLTYDATNRDGGALAPVVEWGRRFGAADGLQEARVSFARTTQVPSYTALNSSPTSGLFRGNAALGREYSDNLELALSGTAAGWHWDGALFNRWDDDLVDWTYSSANLFARNANAVDIVTQGVELFARRDFDWGSVTLGYTWLTKDADYGSANVTASFYALNYARQRLTAAFTVRLSRDWELRVDNEARLQAANALRTAGGDDALLTSAALIWRPRAWRGVEFSLQADNLWDSDFQEVPAVPAARRQLAVGAAYAW